MIGKRFLRKGDSSECGFLIFLQQERAIHEITVPDFGSLLRKTLLPDRPIVGEIRNVDNQSFELYGAPIERRALISIDSNDLRSSVDIVY